MKTMSILLGINAEGAEVTRLCGCILEGLRLS